MKPLVSIIIPTYNRAHLIKQTLDSVLKQTYKKWECIIVDDGSEDDTAQLICRFSETDSRIRYIKRSSNFPKGAASCRNIGLSVSTGEYIQFLDSDDIISPEKIGAQVDKMENDKAFSLITCKWGHFKKNAGDAEIFNDFPSYADFDTPADFLNSLPRSLNFFPIHSYLIRRQVINKAGFWNEYLNFNEDAEFIIRIIANSQKIGFSEKALALYREASGGNVSEYSDIKKVRDGLKSWKLIELYIKVRFGEQADPFLNKGKGEFYLKIKDFPEIIEEQSSFFKDQINNDPSKKGFFNRIRKKIN
ncbi:MAG: glycosyltransferase family 2 protein [Christiangramia sp.]|uniref:glycosyltransferase family 2 protein n=1 Tax=Christiangramia sp. TaxID=1931228 RepID=UPI003241E5C8